MKKPGGAPCCARVRHHGQKLRELPDLFGAREAVDGHPAYHQPLRVLDGPEQSGEPAWLVGLDQQGSDGQVSRVLGQLARDVGLDAGQDAASASAEGGYRGLRRQSRRALALTVTTQVAQVRKSGSPRLYHF